VTWTLADLEDGSTLVTVNNRLAVELRARYDSAQAKTGQVVWPSADILPWKAWLQRLYERLLDTGCTELDLLSPAQERLLWEDIVSQQAATAGLLRPVAAAESARSAFSLYTEWRLGDQPLGRLGGEETGRFLNWMRAFEVCLKERGQLSAAQLPHLLTRAFDRGALEIPRQLVHSGFDTLSPVQRLLFDTLGEQGCVIDEHRSEDRNSIRQRVEAVDSEAEMRLAARWSRNLLHANPRPRIGIVSLRITQQRHDLERVFGEIVTPTAYLSNTASQDAFNISLGEPLSECPQIAHALLALRLLGGEQTLNDVGQLLRSPFIGGHAGEWEQRALFDAALREQGLPRMDLQRLINRFGRFESGDPRHCPDLAARVRKLHERRRELPDSDTPNGWAGHFQAVLGELGWPGDRPLDSEEFQQRERMQRVFSELAGLGKVRPGMRLGEAVKQVCKLAAEALFQPKSPPTPIQILGGLEAAGMDFDAIWLLGMDDQNWPPAPHPDPLLPPQLQRELEMPHASAERELAFAEALTERLAKCATTVVASHARSEADREQRPSPLIHDWILVDDLDLAGPETVIVREACAATGRLEPMPAARADGAPSGQSGGAMLLAAQANCPFQAVARFRLKAIALAEASFAPDGALIGKLVHELLQRIWRRLGDSANLAEHDDSALLDLIEPLAVATLNDIGRDRPDLFTPRFRAIEAARLSRLMLAWLTLERQRVQPFEIAALEQDQTIELAGLRLRTRADRVDRLADGSLAVIDYKTGRNVRNDGWFDQRLTEPQLPLYCLHSTGKVEAALLARVRRDGPGCRFVGLTGHADFAPGVDTPQLQDGPDWAGLLAQWQRALGGLAAEIVEGRADATPSPQACQYCALGALCRVQEMITENDSE